jgi:hypothetical protein
MLFPYLHVHWLALALHYCTYGGDDWLPCFHIDDGEDKRECVEVSLSRDDYETSSVRCSEWEREREKETTQARSLGFIASCASQCASGKNNISFLWFLSLSPAALLFTWLLFYSMQCAAHTRKNRACLLACLLASFTLNKKPISAP